MSLYRVFLCGVVFVIGLCVLPETARAADPSLFDDTPAWPLCGRITENPPAGWTAAQGCPAERWGNADYSDFPLSATFGPRLLSSGNDRFDYHRGLDIATPTGTPIFAIADGLVRKAGNDSSFEDPVIQIRHYRPGNEGKCKPVGCYHSQYQHLSDWVVAVGDTVEKGQLIGYSGASSNGFEHLHLEIRSAPPEDASSSWSRDAIHPLSFLPYHGDPALTQVNIISVDAFDPMNPIVEVEVVQAAGAKTWDVNRVEVEVYDNSTSASIPQPGAVLNGDGYYVNPPWLDMEVRNFQYSHKNSSSIPWSSFDTCPYADEHGKSYEPELHIDRQDPEDYQAGLFNGIRTAITKYSNPSRDYNLTLRFDELTGAASGDLCVVVHATNARGDQSVSATWNCP